MHELVWSNLIVKKLKGVEQQTVLKMIDKIENIKANPQFYIKEIKGIFRFFFNFQKKLLYLISSYNRYE
ncbi:hypothetical protein J4417_05325 [Candidatus Woesearchaeota archaeon]|nr:hypothetical protein [Candidatus Woesearchaeota archaeon]